MSFIDTIIPIIIFILLGFVLFRAFKFGELFTKVGEWIRRWKDGREEKGLDLQSVQYE